MEPHTQDAQKEQLYVGLLDSALSKNVDSGINYQIVEFIKTSNLKALVDQTPIPSINLSELDQIHAKGPLAVYDGGLIGIYVDKYNHKYLIKPRHQYTYTHYDTDYFIKYGTWTYLIIVTPLLVTFDVVTGTVGMTGCVLFTGIFSFFTKTPECMAIPRYYLDISSH